MNEECSCSSSCLDSPPQMMQQYTTEEMIQQYTVEEMVQQYTVGEDMTQQYTEICNESCCTSTSSHFESSQSSDEYFSCYESYLPNNNHYNNEQYNDDNYNDDHYNDEQYNDDHYNDDQYNEDNYNGNHFNDDHYNDYQYNDYQYNDDNLSCNSRFYEDYTDSYIDEDRTTTESYSNSRSTSDSIFSSSNSANTTMLTKSATSHQSQPPKNGILKTRGEKNTTWARRPPLQEMDGDYNENGETQITQRTIDKIREYELEDVLQYARDIVKPDPAAKLTFSIQPAKVIPSTFKHLMSIKETYSKTGAFKYRTVFVIRNLDDDLGINLRHGDGWEKKDGIYISRVALGTIFDKYEVFTVGDELMLVNKVNVKKMSIDDAIRLMHIPRKLSITVKVLTPFSQKRIANTGIDTYKNGGKNNNNNNNINFKNKKNNKVIAGSHCKGSSFKVAQLKIGDEMNKNISKYQQKANKSVNTEKITKLSPYRTIEGGRTVQQHLSKQMLSPIREFSSDGKEAKQRKRSIVRWSDQG